MPDSKDAAIINHDCALKPGSQSYAVSALTVLSGFNFLVSSDLAVVQSSFFNGNTAVYGTLTISGLNNGFTANLSTASANVGGGSGPTGTSILHVGDPGNGAPGDMSVQGTLSVGSINPLTVGGTDGGICGAKGELNVVGLDALGPVTDYINGTINISSAGIFTGTTNVYGKLEAPNGATVTLNGRGLLDSSGKIDGGTIIFSKFSTWAINANGSNLGNMGDGHWFISGPLAINGAREQPQGDITLDNDGGVTTAGSITGTGSLDLWTAFNWNGGNIGLSGGATIEPQADFKAAGANNKFMTTGTITNNNLLTELGGAGSLTLYGGATFLVAHGQVKVSLPAISGAGPRFGNGLFHNVDTVEFEAPASTPTLVSCNFTNDAYLKVAAGSAAILSALGSAGPGAVIKLDGTLMLDGDLTLSGSISSPTGLDVSAGGGTLKIGGGTMATSAVLTLPVGMTIGANGNVEVTNLSTLTGGGQVSNSGTLTLDNGSSTTGLGSYQETSTGTLGLQAASAANYSRLKVTGVAQLSGTLKMDFVGGYTPKKGASFRVLDAGTIGAHFDTTPADMTVTYDSAGVTLTQN
jgi:hypothetical protein